MSSTGWLDLSLLALAVLLVATLRLLNAYLGTRRSLLLREEAFAAVAGESRDWLWQTDLKLRFTYCSAGVHDLLGYEPEDLLGVSTLSLLTPDQVTAAEKMMRGAATTGSGWEGIEFVWRNADGRPVLLQGTAAPVHDDRGVLVGFRGPRRRVTVAMEAERQHSEARTRIDAMIRDAALDVALQPIVNLGTGRVSGVEALTRFRDGRSPDAWFRDATTCGKARALDVLAFSRAVQALSALPRTCYLSINASPDLICDPAFLQRLGELGGPLEQLVVEVTEHVHVEDYAELHRAVEAMRERGIRLAVDDTGAGYASLSHVLQLRPDIIKIDRSLVANVASDPARRSLVTALVLLSLDLGARVTGEGIEAVSELDTLIDLGVDEAQGFLLARPSTDPSRWATWWGRDFLHRAPEHRLRELITLR